jgi:flagellar protein FliO/FliZ
MIKLIRSIGFTTLLLTSDLVFAVESDSTKLGDAKVLAGGGLSDPNMAGSLIQTTLGLLVVLAVIGGVAWAFKRFGHFQAGMQGKMKVIGGVSLGARERVVLLQVGEQQLVLGVAPGRIQTLHVLDNPLPIDNESTGTTSFSARLQSAIANRAVKPSAEKSSEKNSADKE